LLLEIVEGLLHRRLNNKKRIILKEERKGGRPRERKKGTEKLKREKEVAG